MDVLQPPIWKKRAKVQTNLFDIQISERVRGLVYVLSLMRKIVSTQIQISKSHIISSWQIFP